MLSFLLLMCLCCCHFSGSSTPSFVQKHSFFDQDTPESTDSSSKRNVKAFFDVRLASRFYKSKFLNKPEDDMYYLEPRVEFGPFFNIRSPYISFGLGISSGISFPISLSIGYWGLLQGHFEYDITGEKKCIGVTINPFDKLIVGYGYGEVFIYSQTKGYQASEYYFSGAPEKRQDRHFLELGYQFYKKYKISMKYELSPDYKYEGFSTFFSYQIH